MNLKFLPYDSALCQDINQRVNSSIYDDVFWGDIDAENLEEIFTKFNTESHPLHRGHSLSVSDIVKTDEGAFFCDSIGFKEVDFDETLAQKSDNLMKIVYVEPNRKPFVSEVEHTLEAEQKAVKGYIEAIYIDDENVCLVGNEEAKLIGMEGNRRIGGNSIIAGPFFVVGLTEDDFRSLTDKEIEEYMDYFSEPEQISEEEVQGDMGFSIYTF
jgi:hypothetical protein